MVNGWQVIDFAPASQTEIRKAIKSIESYIGCALTDYARESDEEHIQIQSNIANRFIEGGYGRRIIEGSLSQFQALLGSDLHIQRYPYLRIARPGRAQDNIGIHRDTLYGGTPYEVSCVIPLTTMPAEGALHVIDRSHVAPETAYPFEREDTDVVKGSDKHKLGFVYSRKRLAADLPTHPVEVRVGQCLAFPLSLVHGQEVNQAKHARFSVDIRLVNSLAPIEWSHTVHADYWEPLCSSPVTEQARRYYAEQT